MELRHLSALGLTMAVGCSPDLKPWLYSREFKERPYVDDDDSLAMAYRKVNDYILVAVLHSEWDYIDFSFITYQYRGFGSGWLGDYEHEWEEEWFHRCSREEQRFVCRSEQEGPVLFGTINSSHSFTLFGSGDPTDTMKIKEFSLEFGADERNWLAEDGNEQWAELNSDFDTWLNH